MAARARRLPETLAPHEQAALLAQPSRRYPTGRRDALLLRLMLNLGLRSAELRGLAVADVDWLSGQLRVRKAKGGRERALWLSPDDLQALGAWRQERPVQAELLFTTLAGRPIAGRQLRAMVKRRAARAGITKDVHPHMLRHSFATDLYRQTRNLVLVQRALGHADISTTTIYTHLVDGELEEALRGLRGGAPGGGGSGRGPLRQAPAAS